MVAAVTKNADNPYSGWKKAKMVEFFRREQRSNTESAWKQGHALLHIRDNKPYGTWGDFLKEIEMSETTAWRLLGIAEKWKTLEEFQAQGFVLMMDTYIWAGVAPKSAKGKGKGGKGKGIRLAAKTAPQRVVGIMEEATGQLNDLPATIRDKRGDFTSADKAWLLKALHHIEAAITKIKQEYDFLPVPLPTNTEPTLQAMQA